MLKMIIKDKIKRQPGWQVDTAG